MSGEVREFVASLFRQYGHELFGFLSARLRSHEAEDVAQKTYLQLLQHPDPGLIENPRAYLFKTASNMLVDHVRRQKVHSGRLSPDVELESVVSPFPDPEAVADSDLQLQRFRAALASLPAECRTVFLLNRIDGLTHEEIAQRLGISKRTVARYIIRALDRCQRRMSGSGL
jgi:RNA polymerase sigma-70 factor (ECF subfamily)